jgi:hypothetical protein
MTSPGAVVVGVFVILAAMHIRTRIAFAFLSLCDVLAGLLLMSVPRYANVSLFSLGIESQLMFYVGVALVVKGVYSIVAGMRQPMWISIGTGIAVMLAMLG